MFARIQRRRFAGRSTGDEAINTVRNLEFDLLAQTGFVEAPA